MTDIKEYPILFFGPMVEAILEGRKTQTRRLVRPEPGETFWQHRGYELRPHSDRTMHFHDLKTGEVAEYAPIVKMSYGQPCDRLWVRETFNVFRYYEGDYGGDASGEPIVVTSHKPALPFTVEFKADGNEGPWRPSIHMPRWACRITLEVTAVRVERLQAIKGNDEDMLAEGIEPCMDCDAKNYLHHQGVAHCTDSDFVELWDSINAKRGYPWESNPWVWVISFRKVTS